MTFEEALAGFLEGRECWTARPFERGGESFKGISRVKWPYWAGWPVVDNLKAISISDRRFVEGHLEHDETMTQLVKEHYYRECWEPLEYLPPALRAEVFLTAAETDMESAVMLLQRAAGLPEDGILGPRTLAAATDGAAGLYRALAGR
jgi:lysozyme family protein